MHLWYLDAYPVPSHAAIRAGWRRYSRYPWVVKTLPPRLWRWRLRSGAGRLAARVRSQLSADDVVVTTSMTDVARLKGLLGVPVPVVQLMHETQLTYARAPRGAADLFATQAWSMLAADRVVFNSRYHRDAYFAAHRRCRREWPRNEVPPLAPIQRKSVVVYPGIAVPDEPVAHKPRPPLLLWNHRWCDEKRPEWLLAVLRALRDAAPRLPWRLAVVGSPNEHPPAVMATIRHEFSARLAVWGHQPRRQYWRWLRQADCVLSTAAEENFGLAVLEAAAHGALPVVPASLVYPEVLPRWWHPYGLGASPQALADNLLHLWRCPEGDLRRLRRRLMLDLRRRYTWVRQAAALDAVVAANR